ncbi:MAG: DUF6156 family protein [Proteobacteria bacterium]|nr:DUF6156 family protein [Pseudomonadota bacterium]
MPATRKLSILLVLAFGIGIAPVFAEEPVRHVHYGSFAGYWIPLHLVEPIDREIALSRQTYYIGFYDKAGKLCRVEKYFDGALFFRHDYAYYENGVIRESRIRNADGVEAVNRLDERGTRRD